MDRPAAHRFVEEPNTTLLILAARKIGEFVAMGLKDHYRMRRPARVYPWIMPLIDGPGTPSLPSSHSPQAHLISGALKLAPRRRVGPPPVAAGAPPSVVPFPPAVPMLYPQTARALDELADRVALNREIAVSTTAWTAGWPLRGPGLPAEAVGAGCGAFRNLEYRRRQAGTGGSSLALGDALHREDPMSDHKPYESAELQVDVADQIIIGFAGARTRSAATMRATGSRVC